MKTTMKQLTAGTILALLLMAVNVHAEGKETAKASSLEATETTLDLENWMIDDNIWNGTSSFNFENATDETLNLEDWMISDATWANTQNIEVKTEKDSELKIESWMTDTTVWNR